MFLKPFQLAAITASFVFLPTQEKSIFLKHVEKPENWVSTVKDGLIFEPSQAAQEKCQKDSLINEIRQASFHLNNEKNFKVKDTLISAITGFFINKEDTVASVTATQKTLKYKQKNYFIKDVTTDKEINFWENGEPSLMYGLTTFERNGSIKVHP